MKYLIVVDMQKDFIDGALGTPEAQAILPRVQDEILAKKQEGWAIVFTQDTHGEDYLLTQEGRNLPVPHCIRASQGWQIDSSLDTENCLIIDKPGFGSQELAQYLQEQEDVELVELIGLCTDICVISNAMLIKAALPEATLCVKATCCAGVTPQSHENALEAMKMCQIQII